MATGGCEDTSDEIFNFKCTPCARKNRNREAVKYCVECQGYCCQSCADIHEDFPALEGHQLLDKSNFKSAGLTSDLPEVPTVRCRIHKIKVMDMYCGNHDVVGCTSCMALTHRSCTDVQLIPDIINTVFKNADIGKTSMKIQGNMKQLQKIIDARISLLKELSQSKAEAINAIREFRKEMETVLQNLEKESLNEVEREYVKKKSTLEEEKKKAENELDSIKKAGDEMQHSETNKAQQFVNMKIAEENVTNADGIISSMETPTDVKIKFQEDPEIRHSLNRLKSLGKVNIRPSAALETRQSVYSIGSTSNMNIRLSNDISVCHVVGSCLTESGMLLFTDFNNKKLKRTYVPNLSAIDQCDFPDAPRFVCSTGKQEAAVTFNSKTIQFVSLGNQMTRTRQLDIGHRCFGIAYKDDKLYITDNNRSLYIHDMAGNLLQTVSQDNSWNAVFSRSRQIAFSDSGDRMFVVDWNNRMITFDIQGYHIHTFTDSDLDRAYWIDTDRRGNVFVCGFGSNNVIQIGQDGKKKGVIATKSNGIVNPLSISFDPKECKLYVTQRDCDIIKVFKLH